MKTSELKSDYYMFGNKGAVWSDQAHIAKSYSSTTLCGSPMLSSNWARIQNLKECNCPGCVEIYNNENNVGTSK